MTMHLMNKGALTALVLVLASAAVPQLLVAQPRPAPAQAAAPAWPHDRSDIAAEPRARFGILPNGMRYVVLRNGTPPGAGSLRLRIDAGSLHEREDQRGLAHFIEHLVLNETRNVPEGEFIRILERAGLKFGPDTNASTGFEQTIYMLDLPKTDAQTVDTGLFLMREVAGEATLRDEVIERERGVILAEERTRAVPMLNLAQDELAFTFKGDRLGERLPIGLPEVIRSAPRQRFVDFYNAFYRPERATLIAVGDFDVAAMEAKIRQRFSDWKGRGAPGADLPPLQLPRRDTEFRVFQQEGVPTRVLLGWAAPADKTPDSRATRIADIRRNLALQILGRRFEQLAAGENPPFIAGAALRARLADRADVTQLVGIAQPQGWERALQAVEQEHRRALQFGFSQAELDREISETRARLTAAVSGANTRTSPNLAMAIVGAVNEDKVFTSPQTELELFNAAVESLTPDQVNAVYRSLFETGAPLVHLATSVQVPNGEAAVRTAVETSRQVAVAAPAAQQARSWPYTNFGAPGEVVERKEIAEVGATAVRFANGVRLTVKPTKFQDNEILVTARFGKGLLGLPSGEAPPIWAFQAGGFTYGGLKQLSYEELQQVLAGKVYGAAAGVAEDAFTLSGKTRPEDLATQLQVLAAYLREPGWRASAYDRLRSFSGTIHDQLESSPQGVFQRDSAALLRSGDQRWAIPSREAMANTPVEALSGLVAPALAAGPLEVIIVGDVTVDEAIRQVAATFGALPPRQPAAAPAAVAIRPPAGGSVTLTHKGRPDQALGFVAWPTTGYHEDRRRARALNLLAQVFQLRLTDEIRERQGTAYSPNASHEASETVPGYGYLGALVEAPPSALDAFFQSARDIARALREQPIAADELERARRPMIEAMQRGRNSSNQFWLSELAGLHEHPDRAAAISRGIAEVSAVTAAELQQLARQYLTDDKLWRLSVLPAQR